MNGRQKENPVCDQKGSQTGKIDLKEFEFESSVSFH